MPINTSKSRTFIENTDITIDPEYGLEKLTINKYN